MNKTLATFMKIALTAVVISGLLFYVGYKMLDDESDLYEEYVETEVNDVLVDFN